MKQYIKALTRVASAFKHSGMFQNQNWPPQPKVCWSPILQITLVPKFITKYRVYERNLPNRWTIPLISYCLILGGILPKNKFFHFAVFCHLACDEQRVWLRRRGAVIDGNLPRYQLIIKLRQMSRCCLMATLSTSLRPTDQNINTNAHCGYITIKHQSNFANNQIIQPLLQLKK